jgi:hypothetical protein
LRKPTPARHALRPGRCAWLVAALLPLVLVACSGDQGPPPPCPAVVRVSDASHLTRFVGAGRDLTDVAFEAGVRRTDSACYYGDNSIEVDLTLQFGVAEGPANPNHTARFSYFVAVATKDRKILAREEFPIEVAFESNRRQMVALDEVVPTIPLKEGENGNDYLVFVGIAMTPAELQYNQENR